MRFLSPAWLLALVPVAACLAAALRVARRHPPGGSPARRRLSLALRAASALLLVAALAGMAVSARTDRLSVLFLLDQSRSVSDEERTRALDVVAAVRRGLGQGDSAWLVRFGAGAEVEALAPGAAPDPGEGAVDGTATDIGGALQAALAQAEPGTAPRVVLLSDGRENRGSASAAAQAARSAGARVFTVPLGLPGPGAAALPEVAVEDVQAPDRVRRDEPHEVDVLLHSATAVSARVSLFRDGEPVATRTAALVPGENVVSFTTAFASGGLHAWDAIVEAPGDAVPQNDRGRRLVEVTGPPTVLYAAGPGRRSPSFLAALAAQGIAVEERAVTDLPSTLAQWMPYDALVLDNAPGQAVSTEKMEIIARYVEDTGGGLLMAGGDSSFGAGGWYRTPVEKALPVDMDVSSRVQLPRLSLVILVDKSGSMGSAVATGESKLDVVKSAALSAIEALNPYDTVGLLAFDADWTWAVPMGSAGDSERIASLLSTLAAGGGTLMYPAMEEAERALAASPSPLRHVIALSDGNTNAGDFQGLVARMASARITVSTVAVGEDADRSLLQEMARIGGGRYYSTNDPRDVPRIFMAETTLLSRGLLVEKGFFPAVVSSGETMRGIELSRLPGLQGFVLTYPKDGAETVLAALYDAPLLATWRYGLGRTAAWTSDLRGRWSSGWLAWDQFSRFSAQLVRWVERPAGSDVLHPRVTREGGTATVTVDAYDPAGAFVDGLSVRATVSGPDGARRVLDVAQAGPGLYRASFPATATGDWVVSVSAGTAEDAPSPVTTGLSIPYSDEYRAAAADTALLSRIASTAGGRVVDSAEDAEGLRAILAREPGLSTRGEGPWQLLLLLGLLLFVLQVAVRRAVLPEGLRGRLAAALRRLRPERGPSWEDLSVAVQKAREEEKHRIRQRIAAQAHDREPGVDTDLAAYLYIARVHGRRAAREEKEKNRG